MLPYQNESLRKFQEIMKRRKMAQGGGQPYFSPVPQPGATSMQGTPPPQYNVAPPETVAPSASPSTAQKMGFMQKLLSRLSSAGKEGLRGVAMGPERYQQLQYQRSLEPMLQRQARTKGSQNWADFQRRLSATTAAQEQLAATKAGLKPEPTMTPYQEESLGIKKEAITEKTEKRKQEATQDAKVIYTDMDKFDSYAKAKAHFDMMRNDWINEGVDVDAVWQEITDFWNKQGPRRGVIGGLLPGGPTPGFPFTRPKYGE